MPEILSKQEIDRLMSGLSTGQDKVSETAADSRKAGKEAITFDFRLPHRLSKAQLRTFQAIHEDFGEAFGAYLASRLQTNVTITVSSVDQLFYSEYIPSIANPSSLYVFRMLESDALAVLEVCPSLLLAIVEHLMGGVAEGEKNSRPITKIEQSIVKGIVLRALEDVQRAWKTVSPLTFALERYEIEADFVQIAPTSEIVMVVAFEVILGAQKHTMNLCFPTFALEGVLASLTSKHANAVGRKEGVSTWHSPLLHHLGATRVEAVAVLGETALTLRELLTLEPGDIVRTNIPVTGEVQVRIEGKTRVLGRAGVSKGKMAVRVSTVLGDHSSGA